MVRHRGRGRSDPQLDLTSIIVPGGWCGRGWPGRERSPSRGSWWPIRGLRNAPRTRVRPCASAPACWSCQPTGGRPSQRCDVRGRAHRRSVSCSSVSVHAAPPAGKQASGRDFLGSAAPIRPTGGRPSRFGCPVLFDDERSLSSDERSFGMAKMRCRRITVSRRAIHDAGLRLPRSTPSLQLAHRKIRQPGCGSVHGPGSDHEFGPPPARA